MLVTPSNPPRGGDSPVSPLPSRQHSWWTYFCNTKGTCLPIIMITPSFLSHHTTHVFGPPSNACCVGYQHAVLIASSLMSKHSCMDSFMQSHADWNVAPIITPVQQRFTFRTPFGHASASLPVSGCAKPARWCLTSPSADYTPLT